MQTPLEIERKFLITMPSLDVLNQGVKWEIEQTYLVPKGNEDNRRVRRSQNGDEVIYTCTAKTRVTPITCIEEEKVIDEAEYLAELAYPRAGSATVKKTRYKIPYGNRIVEIDVYPFWDEVAVLEVELESETEELVLPPEITILREVTTEGMYKNTNIAKWLFAHPGTPLPL